MNWFRRLFRRSQDLPEADLNRADTRSKNLPEADLNRAYAQLEAGDYGPAIASLKELAAAGVPRACNALSKCYSEGLGVERHRATARRWLEAGAEGGDPVSQRNLGTQHLLGPAGQLGYPEVDSGRAIHFLEAAARQNDASAQEILGSIYFKRKETKDNATKAFYWAKKAAEAGMVSSMGHLATLYHEGAGVQQDLALASRWWRAAAERGHAGAQLAVATALIYGIRSPADPVEGLAWAIRAHRSERGDKEVTAAIVQKGLQLNDAAGIAEAERRAREPLPGAQA